VPWRLESPLYRKLLQLFCKQPDWQRNVALLLVFDVLLVGISLCETYFENSGYGLLSIKVKCLCLTLQGVGSRFSLVTLAHYSKLFS
jgi:hypothetical protein